MRVSEDLSKNGIGVKVSDFSLSDLTEKNIIQTEIDLANQSAKNQ